MRECSAILSVSTCACGDDSCLMAWGSRVSTDEIISDGGSGGGGGDCAGGSEGTDGKIISTNCDDWRKSVGSASCSASAHSASAWFRRSERIVMS